MNSTVINNEKITDLKKIAESVEINMVLVGFDDITKEEISKLIEKIKKL